MANKGSFKKGDPRPAGAGKKKGTKNKATREVEEVIGRMVEYISDPAHMAQILADCARKTPHVLVNFMGRIAPKDLSINHSGLAETVVLYLPENARDKT